MLRRITAGILQHLADFCAVTIAAAAVLLLAWATVPVLLLPLSPTIVMSGSMNPTIRGGDIVLTAPFGPADRQVGRVLLFDDGGSGARRLHRLHRIDDDGRMWTKGDANANADSAPVGDDQVHGAGRLLVPYAGLPALWLRTGRLDALALCLLTIGAAGAWLHARAAVVFGPRAQPHMGTRRHAVVAVTRAAVVLTVVGAAVVPPASASFVARTPTSVSVRATTLQPPVNVTAVPACRGALLALRGGALVSWSPPSGYQVDRYIIERSKNGGAFETVGPSNPTSPHFDDLTLLGAIAGEAFRYRVRAVAEGTAAWTSAASPPTAEVRRPPCPLSG